jgi:hypothetical protein
MQPDIPTLERKKYHDDEQTRFFRHPRDRCRSFADLRTRHSREFNSSEGEQRRLVHGLFADGSCWSEVIARLQAAGLNATAVQNPLTTLPEAVESAQRVLARQDGPTVLVAPVIENDGNF